MEYSVWNTTCSPHVGGTNRATYSLELLRIIKNISVEGVEQPMKKKLIGIEPKDEP